jgi:hypothetical protein
MLEKWLFSGIARKEAMVRPDVNHEAVRLPDGSTRAMGPELVISPPPNCIGGSSAPGCPPQGFVCLHEVDHGLGDSDAVFLCVSLDLGHFFPFLHGNPRRLSFNGVQPLCLFGFFLL